MLIIKFSYLSIRCCIDPRYYIGSSKFKHFFIYRGLLGNHLSLIRLNLTLLSLFSPRFQSISVYKLLFLLVKLMSYLVLLTDLSRDFIIFICLFIYLWYVWFYKLYLFSWLNNKTFFSFRIVKTKVWFLSLIPTTVINLLKLHNFRNVNLILSWFCDIFNLWKIYWIFLYIFTIKSLFVTFHLVPPRKLMLLNTYVIVRCCLNH